MKATIGRYAFVRRILIRSHKIILTAIAEDRSMQEHIRLSAAEAAAIRVSGVFLVWAIIQTTHDATRGKVKPKSGS